MRPSSLIFARDAIRKLDRGEASLLDSIECYGLRYLILHVFSHFLEEQDDPRKSVALLLSFSFQVLSLNLVRLLDLVPLGLLGL